MNTCSFVPTKSKLLLATPTELLSCRIRQMVFAVALAPPSGLRSLPDGRSRIHSLCSWISPPEIPSGSLYMLADYTEVCHKPVLQKSTYHIPLRNPAKACASFSIRNPFFADASRPKSAGAPLKSHKVEQVPPCIYRAELVGDLASPSPSFFRLLKDKKQAASGLFSASKPWHTP